MRVARNPSCPSVWQLKHAVWFSISLRLLLPDITTVDSLQLIVRQLFRNCKVFAVTRLLGGKLGYGIFLRPGYPSPGFSGLLLFLLPSQMGGVVVNAGVVGEGRG